MKICLSENAVKWGRGKLALLMMMSFYGACASALPVELSKKNVSDTVLLPIGKHPLLQRPPLPRPKDMFLLAESISDEECLSVLKKFNQPGRFIPNNKFREPGGHSAWWLDNDGILAWTDMSESGRVHDARWGFEPVSSNDSMLTPVERLSVDFDNDGLPESYYRSTWFSSDGYPVQNIFVSKQPMESVSELRGEVYAACKNEIGEKYCSSSEKVAAYFMNMSDEQVSKKAPALLDVHQKLEQWWLAEPNRSAAFSLLGIDVEKPGLRTDLNLWAVIATELGVYFVSYPNGYPENAFEFLVFRPYKKSGGKSNSGRVPRAQLACVIKPKSFWWQRNSD